MSKDSSKLITYILEKEKQEKAQRKKRLALLIGGGGVICVGLLMAITGGFSNVSKSYREYKMEELSIEKVETIFREEPSAILVKSRDQRYVDTINSLEDYRFLLAAIDDDQENIPMLESGEDVNGPSQASFSPALAMTAKGNGEKAEPIKVDGPLKVADVMPSFPGGESALYRFLSKQIRYPTLATQHKIEGKVYVRFVIQPDGSIGETKILRGIGHGCDEEAIRVIKMMPNWNPGEIAGQKVPVFSSLAVNFKFL